MDSIIFIFVGLIVYLIYEYIRDKSIETKIARQKGECIQRSIKRMKDVNNCPFCGSDELEWGQEWGPKYHHKTPGHYIVCSKCGSRSGAKGTKRAAKRLWNCEADRTFSGQNKLGLVNTLVFAGLFALLCVLLYLNVKYF